MSESLPPPQLVEISSAKLTSSRERRYFPWVVLVSVLVWLAIAVSMIGIVYGVLIGFFIWMGQGLLAAYLKAEGVRVSQRQLPELHATFEAVCRRLGVVKMPSLYVIQQGGFLNAFAMRSTGRDFVVVYSEALEAYGPNSAEMKFLLGHEVGHLWSKHPLKSVLLAPGMFFPLIGPAYRRAWETSCDRHGAHAAGEVEGSVRAMMILSGGRETGRYLDPQEFADQHEGERGFFVSLHEYTSTYPTLSRRVTDLLAIATGESRRHPPRNPLAFLFAMITPGGGVSGGLPGILMIVVIVGLLAAMAIPAFQKVREASIEKVCLNNQRMLVAAFDQYSLEHDEGASSFDDIVGPDKYLIEMPICPQQGVYGARIDEDGYYVAGCTVHGELSGLGGTPSP